MKKRKIGEKSLMSLKEPAIFGNRPWCDTYAVIKKSSISERENSKEIKSCAKRLDLIYTDTYGFRVTISFWSEQISYVKCVKEVYIIFIVSLIKPEFKEVFLSLTKFNEVGVNLKQENETAKMISWYKRTDKIFFCLWQNYLKR